ncbi:MAG: hypothetical protein ACRDS0_31660 [Pseudonocardiaceae bacterium]
MTGAPNPPEESCPGCGHLEGVELTSATARVVAWTCTRCGMGWAHSVVNPCQRPFLDHLAGTVELAVARSTLREVCALADQAPGLTDTDLRARLLALAQRAVPAVGRSR